MAPSPNSLTMYEQDQSGLQRASCGSDDPVSPTLDFDLKPQFECNDDSLFKLDLATLNLAFGNLPGGIEDSSLKMEDVFQVEKSRDIAQGPTLAELNFENSITTPGFMEDSDAGFAQQKSAPIYTTAIQSQQQQQQQQRGAQQTLQWNAASFLTSCLARPSLRAYSAQASQPTHTVSSPTAAKSLQPVKTEVSDGDNCAFEVTGKFSFVPGTTCVQAASSDGTPPHPETKSALADLLTQTPTPMAVGGVTFPVQVKTEAELKQQQACQHSSNLTVLTPLKRSGKRSVSPDNTSNTSVERKWEEIKQFIHDDEAPNFSTSNEEPPPKKIKTEPEGIARSFMLKLNETFICTKPLFVSLVAPSVVLLCA